jgi:dehydrogenase/reductase SDR family protein 4
MRFQGKVCVVTAASAGIGLATAQRFAQEGGRVIISSRSQHHVDTAKASFGQVAVDGVVCHVGKAEDRQALVRFVKEKYGRIDVLVCNAAISTSLGPSLQITESAYDKMFDVNVKSTFFLIKEALPLLEQAIKPKIMIVLSSTAYLAKPMLGVYGMTKTALLGMTSMLSNELVPRNIRVNCVAPGVIKTKFSEAIWETPSATDNPMKRIGTVEEVAASVAFLCSDEASYISGETLMIAGGIRSRL